MSNLTLAIDDEVLKRARIRAIEQGTSVNAVVRNFLESYAGLVEQRSALRQILELAEEATSGAGRNGRGWTRDDLYEDRVN